jgi:hypothetical protein
MAFGFGHSAVFTGCRPLAASVAVHPLSGLYTGGYTGLILDGTL